MKYKNGEYIQYKDIGNNTYTGFICGYSENSDDYIVKTDVFDKQYGYSHRLVSDQLIIGKIQNEKLNQALKHASDYIHNMQSFCMGNCDYLVQEGGRAYAKKSEISCGHCTKCKKPVYVSKKD